MNKRILCIVDQYYPESSANTQCADIIMQKFIDNGFRVDFMSIKHDYTLPSITRNENCTIFKFENYITKNMRKYSYVYKAKKWLDMPWAFRKFVGLLNKIKLPFRNSTESVYLDCVSYKDIYKLIKMEDAKYYAVLSFSTPFALHVIASKIKNKKLAQKWFAVFLDPFVYNYCLNPKRIDKRKLVAEKTLKNVDKIFMVRGIKEENLRNCYNPYYHKKVEVIELPNLVEKKLSTKKTHISSEIVLTYSGMFYKDIRNPEKMLDILSKLPKHMQINLIGFGCESIIEKKVNLFSGNLNLLGKQPYSKSIENLSNSNILINLGNTMTNQTPSKVFEYIAFGKPILNFYFSKNDTSLYYFKKYPLALNINLNKYTEKDIVKIKEFCTNNKDKKLDFYTATKNLVKSRSENVTEKIYKGIVEDL